MFVISNNCCGGRLYQQTNNKFNNPFIWMISSYDSIYEVLNNFKNINWFNYEMDKSKIKPNTFIIRIDNKIEINYVHYIFDPTATQIIQKKKYDIEEHWTGDICYNKIWEFVNEKYIERTKRMLSLKEEPCFLIREETLGNSNIKYNLNDIANCNSQYKRIIITKNKNIKRNDNFCKTILVNRIENPEPTVKNNLKIIKEFFNI
jgi:hypothetical protein